MSIWDKLTHELIDIIEWLDSFQRHRSRLAVGTFPAAGRMRSRTARLDHSAKGRSRSSVNEGQLADVFQPRTYTLTTENMPLLSTIRGWKKYRFNSPFKAKSTSSRRASSPTVTSKRTPNPIMLRDPEFGPVRLRAFGTYALRVKLPQALLKQLVGTNRRFTVEDIQGQLRDMIVSRFADALGECKVAALDLASKYDEIGQTITTKISENFTTYGLEVVQFFIENVSFPPEVEHGGADKRSSMGVIGNMQTYRDYQVANAIPEAAKNPGGLAGGTESDSFRRRGDGRAICAESEHAAGAAAGAGGCGVSCGGERPEDRAIPDRRIVGAGRERAIDGGVVGVEAGDGVLVSGGAGGGIEGDLRQRPAACSEVRELSTNGHE